MNGSAEYERFTSLVPCVLAAPRSDIKERVEEHRRRAARDAKRREPKGKSKPRRGMETGCG